MMLVGSIIRGNPVRVAFDLTTSQIAASAHALEIHRGERYRLAELSVDDTLALRELTLLIDRFRMLSSHGAHDTVQLTVAQLMQLSDVLRDFVAANAQADGVHPESRGRLAGAASLVGPLAELAGEALKMALEDPPEVDVEHSRFDSLLGDP